jgi:DNA-binding MarR family transcriptional regulator
MDMVSRSARPDILEFDLGYNCYRLSQLIRDDMAEQFKRLSLDITPEQWHLLLCLSTVPDGMTPSTLANIAQRDKTTISRMLEVMERRDLIDKVHRAKDGRSYLIRLSPQSRQIIDQSQQSGILQGASTIFAPLSGAERELLLALIQKCRRSVGDM